MRSLVAENGVLKQGGSLLELKAQGASSDRQNCTVDAATAHSALQRRHLQLLGLMSSLPGRIQADVTSALKGEYGTEDAHWQSNVIDEARSIVKEVEASSNDLVRAISGEIAPFVAQVRVRLQTVQGEIREAQSWLVWAQGECSRLQGVLEAGARRKAVQEAARDAEEKLRRCQRVLRRAKEDLEDGHGSQEDVKIADNNLQQQRMLFEDRQKELLRIRNAGFPEIHCSSSSQDDIILPQVPQITMEQLLSLGPLGEPIGRGGFAEVFRLELPATGSVAFKRLRGGGSQAEIMREAKPMWALRHPNLVQLLMVCLDAGSMGLVLEWVEGPVLHHLLHARKLQLQRERKLSILKDVLSGLVFMHQLRHTHLDVKSANILLCGEQGAAKLSDFGATKEQRMTIMDTNVAMTVTHCSPELLSLPRKVSAAADVWAFGMLVYEMETNSIPFEGVSIVQAAKDIEAGRVPLLPKVAQLRQLYERCVVASTEKRATSKELLALVEKQLCMKCGICLEDNTLTDGVICSGNKRHFCCFVCLPSVMESFLEARKSIDAGGGIPCSCSASYPLHLVHHHIKDDLFKRWLERREEQRAHQMEQELRIEKGKLRQEALSLEVAIAGTKKCPFCFLSWFVCGRGMEVRGY